MKRREYVFITWILLALFTLIIIIKTQKPDNPFLTFIWLLIPLFIVMKNKNANLVGFSKVPIKKLLAVTGIYLSISLTAIIIFEIITPTYKMLIELAIDNNQSDITFLWLNKYKGITGYILVFIISFFITIFGEELFFRGLLLQAFKRNFSDKFSILMQSVLFSLPHIIIAIFFMTPFHGLILILGYGIFIYGVMGGWAANKTNSFWPGLITASINNLLLVIYYVGV